MITVNQFTKIDCETRIKVRGKDILPHRKMIY